MFEKILARLGIRGTVADVTDATTGRYASYIPKLGNDNKIHSSMVPIGDVEIGDVTAELVTFDTIPEIESASDITVRTAIDNITKENGHALIRSKNLLDVVNSTTAFNNIKQAATDTDTGVVELATNSETVNASVTDKVVTPAGLCAGFAKLAGATFTGAVNVPAPTADAHASTKLYVDTQFAAASTAYINKTLVVDTANGNDSTAIRGTLSKSYKTITAAKNAAQSGDLIYVYPGTYDENDLAKLGITYYFMPGANVTYTGASGNTAIAIFNMVQDSYCNVYGYGKFTHAMTTGLNRFALYCGNTVNFNFECLSLLSTKIPMSLVKGDMVNVYVRDSIISEDVPNNTGGTALFIGNTTNANVVVYNKIYTLSPSQAAIVLGYGGTCAGFVKAKTIHGVGTAIESILSTAVTIEADEITSDSNVTINMTNSGSLVVKTNRIESSSDSYNTIVLTKGTLDVKNATIKNTQGAIPIYFNAEVTDQPYLILNNCEIWTEGGNEVAIGANNADTYKVRLHGYIQSDCASPTAVTKVGGMWEQVVNGY